MPVGDDSAQQQADLSGPGDGGVSDAADSLWEDPHAGDNAQQQAPQEAQHPYYQSYLNNVYDIDESSGYSTVEILLMIICVLLTLLVLISLTRFCYQIYQNKNGQRAFYKPVNKEIDTDFEDEAQHLNEIV